MKKPRFFARFRLARTIASYTQPGPLGFVDGPSVYAYMMNSPQVFVHPDGCVIPLGRIVIGGLIGFALDAGYQLWNNNGNYYYVDWVVNFANKFKETEVLAYCKVKT